MNRHRNKKKKNTMKNDHTFGGVFPPVTTPDTGTAAAAPARPAHTPEPWHVSHDLGEGISIAHEIAPHCGKLIPLAEAKFWLSAKEPDARETAHANAHRIVACVNACAGMADPAAEIAALRVALEIAATTLETVWKERDPKNIAAKCASQRARTALKGGAK